MVDDLEDDSVDGLVATIFMSMDWFKGKPKGKREFYLQIRGVPSFSCGCFPSTNVYQCLGLCTVALLSHTFSTAQSPSTLALWHKHLPKLRGDMIP